MMRNADVWMRVPPLPKDASTSAAGKYFTPLWSSAAPGLETAHTTTTERISSCLTGTPLRRIE